MNQAAERFLALGGDMVERLSGDSDQLNLALLTLHPEGMRGFLSNWDEIAPSFIDRLRREGMASGDIGTQQFFTDLLKLAGPVPEITAGDTMLPVLPMELTLGDLRLSLFTVITTFGTAQDITTEELRIEAFYPTDQATEAFFQMLAN